MALTDLVSFSHGRSVFFVIVGLLCLIQGYRKWRKEKAIRKLAGKVVLITGASSGLGEALAQAFHSVGARVILAGRNVEKLQQIKFQLDQLHNHTKVGALQHFCPAILELDLTEAHSLKDRAKSALELFGHVDILINNAGVSSRAAVVDTDTKVDRRIMETNYFGPITFTRALLPAMLERGQGHIVVVSSLQGKISLPYRSSYSASKHALHGFFDALRVEVSSKGVHVTTVCPGYIQTKLSMNALHGDGRLHGVTDPSTASGMKVEIAAREVLSAVACGARESLIATHAHKVAVYLKFFTPSLLDWILRVRAKIT